MKLLLISSVLLAIAALSNAKKPATAILLSQVKALTLRDDQLTSARRVKAIPQLKCVGGNAKGLYDVDVMRCKNTGSEYDAESISWTCQANLPSEFKLGSTEVICEGFDNADDPYVLKGSCGVEYRLSLTEQGEARYGSSSWSSKRRSASSSDDEAGPLFKTIFWLVFIGIILLLAYKFLQSLGLNGTPQARRPRRPNIGGSWGGGPGSDDDPPPPYSRRPAQPKQYAQTSNQQQGWRPGFFSGAAAGAAAGYAMGGRNRNPPAQAGPSNWFSSGARNTAPAGSAWGGSSQASSSSAPSSARYESSGFGGTRRR